MEKSEHSYWCWNYKSGSPFWKESSSTLTNSRQRPTVSSNPPFLGKCPRELKTKSTQNLCMEVHSSVFMTVKTWRQPKCSSTDQWINYTYIYVHYNEIFFGSKRNEVSRHTGAWITLGNIMLSQRSQTARATYYRIPSTRNNQDRQIHRGRKHISCYQGLRQGETRE